MHSECLPTQHLRIWVVRTTLKSHSGPSVRADRASGSHNGSWTKNEHGCEYCYTRPHITSIPAPADGDTTSTRSGDAGVSFKCGTLATGKHNNDDVIEGKRCMTQKTGYHQRPFLEDPGSPHLFRPPHIVLLSNSYEPIEYMYLGVTILKCSIGMDRFIGWAVSESTLSILVPSSSFPH